MPREKKPNPKTKRCTETVKRARVDELLRLRLDGAEIWDVREYVRDKEKEKESNWFLKRGETPMSDSNLWRYLALVDEAIKESCRAHRKKLIRTHLAKRRNLYTKSILSGDYRTALQCARDEAELLGIYQQVAKHEVAGPKGGPIPTLIEVVNSETALPPSPASDANESDEADS